MDKTSVIGVLLGVVALLVGMVAKGTSLAVLVNPAAILIIFVGTIAAVLIAFPTNEIKNVPKLFKILFSDQKEQKIVDVIPFFVECSKVARQEGLLSLGNKIEEVEDPFLKQGLQMTMDGMEPEYIRDTMEEEIAAMQDRHAVGAGIFTQAGTYAPTLGVLGAVLGLIAALGDLNDMDALGYAIAAAFVATLFGIFSGYVLWHPFANKLKRKSKQEVMVKQIIVEGVLSIQQGVAPRAIEEKLLVYLPIRERNKLQSTDGKGADIDA
ncbi:flagellar motor stator protein MotA [Desertibacillus haloalkaliphilus]|uniref:flagellar motor stator protein MotA n=1 Tax=Desertibacillus haloalkaliphilus TaxID=1328930 RepID=UPI001C26B477|nr:flagellar motor stator protein MotA [Desertibacillus haloalkaliphilus]MBU8908832.1 flagellar motor stator protein MotA [Desertibacillus haloalkaliphilus]